MSRTATTPNRIFRAAPCRGVGLVEMLLSLIVLAVTVLGFASLVLGQHRAGRACETEGHVFQSAREFMERLRGPDEWGVLYARYCDLEDEAQLAQDPAHRLPDGSFAHLPTAYFPDFAIPPDVSDLLVLVEVPRDAPVYVETGGASLVLREDVSEPRFGLPADLNGDGTIDDEARDTDYVVLPVDVRFQWRTPQGGTQERRFRTWLRGAD